MSAERAFTLKVARETATARDEHSKAVLVDGRKEAADPCSECLRSTEARNATTKHCGADFRFDAARMQSGHTVSSTLPKCNLASLPNGV